VGAICDHLIATAEADYVVYPFIMWVPWVSTAPVRKAAATRRPIPDSVRF